MKTMMRWLSVLALPLGLLVVFACTERNPDYDPEAYCETGTRRCDPSGVILVCTSDNEWPLPDSGDRWIIECWTDTVCNEGQCIPDQDARLRPCVRESDCDAGYICSALVSHEDPSNLSGYCITPPNPGQREAGKPCNTSSQCLSGRCTRNICFEMCQETADCSVEGHECVSLDLTVDGIKYDDGVKGCVVPSS